MRVRYSIVYSNPEWNISDFITAFLMLENDLVPWIGLNDRDNQSDFVWTDESVLNYTNWYGKEPSGNDEVS